VTQQARVPAGQWARRRRRRRRREMRVVVRRKGQA